MKEMQLVFKMAIDETSNQTCLQLFHKDVFVFHLAGLEFSGGDFNL